MANKNSFVSSVPVWDEKLDNPILESLLFHLASRAAPGKKTVERVSGISLFMGMSISKVLDGLISLHKGRHISIKKIIDGKYYCGLTDLFEYSVDRSCYDFVRNGKTACLQDERVSYSEWRRLRETVMELDSGICVYCGEQATHVDHVIPASKGGSDRLDNLVAACAGCNCAKSNLFLSQLGMSFQTGSRPWKDEKNGRAVGSYLDSVQI